MWIIQTVGMNRPDETTDLLIKVLIEKNIPYVTVGLIPFTSEISGLDQIDFDNINTTINIYGSCKFIRLCMEQVPEIKQRVFFDYSSFNYFAYFHNCKSLVNSSFTANLQSISQVLKTHSKKTKHPRFIKPVLDLKPFSGALVPVGTSLHDWFIDRFGTKNYNQHQMVLVGLPITISAEYRFFVVNRKIVAASRYKLNDVLKVSKTIPSGARQAVKNQIKTWLPHDNCVVDVAYVRGEYKIMEFNCINCSGFYSCDIGAIVDALQEYK